MLDELLAEPGVEERCRIGGHVGLLAVHGGIEGGTAEVATAVAERTGASLYAVVQPPTLRWHLPSTTFDPDRSPALRSFLEHVAVAVSVHGYGRRERPRDLLVGGGNREAAAIVAAALRRHLPGWHVVDDLEQVPASMRGLHRANPVNRPRGGGVQLELPPDVRGTTWRWADADVPTPEPGLVAGLADAVSALAAAYDGS